MCYSAMVYAEIKSLERKLGIKIDPDWYVREFWTKKGKDPYKRPHAPRAMELDVLNNGPPETADAVREADHAVPDHQRPCWRDG